MRIRSVTASSATIAGRSCLWEELTLVDSSSSGLLVQGLEGNFCSVLFGIVDELTVIPVTSGDVLALDGDGAGPSSATSCNSEGNVISFLLSKARTLKVGVQLKGGHFSVSFSARLHSFLQRPHTRHIAVDRGTLCSCVLDQGIRRKIK